MTPVLLQDIRVCALSVQYCAECHGRGDDIAVAASVRLLAWVKEQEQQAPLLLGQMTPEMESQVRRLCYAVLGYGGAEPGELRIMAERLLDALSAQEEAYRVNSKAAVEYAARIRDGAGTDAALRWLDGQDPLRQPIDLSHVADAVGIDIFDSEYTANDFLG